MNGKNLQSVLFVKKIQCYETNNVTDIPLLHTNERCIKRTNIKSKESVDHKTEGERNTEERKDRRIRIGGTAEKKKSKQVQLKGRKVERRAQAI